MYFVFSFNSYEFWNSDYRQRSVVKSYIKEFTEKFPLTEYDIKAMPFVLYYWHCMCNYRPDELGDIPDSYKAIAKLINNFLNWLYDNVEELTEELIK